MTSQENILLTGSNSSSQPVGHNPFWELRIRYSHYYYRIMKEQQNSFKTEAVNLKQGKFYGRTDGSVVKNGCSSRGTRFDSSTKR